MIDIYTTPTLIYKQTCMIGQCDRANSPGIERLAVQFTIDWRVKERRKLKSLLYRIGLQYRDLVNV